MGTMNRTSKIILVAAIVVVAAVVVTAFVLVHKAQNTATQAAANQLYNGVASGASAGTKNYSATHTAAPANVTVPNEGATGTVAASVAVPAIQGPAAPGSSASYRSFNISVDNGQFSPSNIAVNLGDTVNLYITAIDKDYAFTQPDYGFNDLLPKGVKKTIQFQANNSGRFEFYCSSCGGPSSGPVGYLTVVSPAAQ